MTTIYDVLVRPLVTEKSSYQSGKLGQYVFVVADAFLLLRMPQLVPW